MAVNLNAFPRPEEVSSLEQAREVIGLQAALIEELLSRIERLESQLAKTSRNSSRPPSSDGYRKPKPKSRRKQSTRVSGGQPGHKGTTLEAVEHADETEVLGVERCQRCGHSLVKQAVSGYERRQVFDVPAPRLHVKEYQAEIKECGCCGASQRAAFPEAVSQAVQYGECVKAMVVYLSQYQLLPDRRLQELLRDLFGVAISQGTLHTILNQCAERLEPFERAVEEQLIASPVAHFDETGMRVANELHWLHVCSTEKLTCYHIDKKRGAVAMDSMGILGRFEGTAVHDHWKPYYRYDNEHALCNAHHLRELIHAHEQHGQRWAQQLIECLLNAKAEVDVAIGRGRCSLAKARLDYHQRRYSRLLRQGREELAQIESPQGKRRGPRKQHPAKNLHDRLTRHKYEVLAFLYDFSIPFDNNQAERDLRMGKVKQKISGCFRSLNGAQAFARVRGYLSTARKNSLNIFDSLILAVKGRPYIPQE
jgi:transposase